MIRKRKEREREREVEREQRQAREDGDRNWNNAAMHQGTARTDNHQKLEEAREDSPLEPLEDRSPADTLISDF